jgi:hypothetical protein
MSARGSPETREKMGAEKDGVAGGVVKNVRAKKDEDGTRKRGM